MSTTFKVREYLENKLDLHFVPAKVKGDGTTDVNNYFNSYIKKDGGGILTNAIRGFPLKGEIVTVPETHRAFVLQESEKSLNVEKVRHLYVTGSFDEFHYWNYDKIPSKADAYKQALQIFNISEELSASVSDSELEDEVERRRCKSGTKENSL